MESYFSIFLTGPHACGKTHAMTMFSVADALLDLVDLGPVLRKEHAKSNSKLDFVEWLKCMEKDQGKNYSDKIICREIEQSISHGKLGIIIVGSRSLAGVKFIMERFAFSKAVLVYVDAKIELLRSRYRKREGKMDISNRDFAQLLDKDEQLGLSTLKKFVLEEKGGVYLINDTDDRSYVKTIWNIIAHLMKKEQTNEASLKPLVYVTSNVHKVEEADRFFAQKYGFNIVIKNPEFEVVEKQATNCQEVAAFSAQYVAKKLGVPALKSDTGIYVDCLGGLPGPYSAYFDKQIGEEKFLALLKNEQNRRVRLEHCFAYCEPNGKPTIFAGGSQGTISYKVRGRKGRWHDKFYIPDGETKTLSELRELDPCREAKYWGSAIDDFAKWYRDKLLEEERKKTKKRVAKKDASHLEFSPLLSFWDSSTKKPKRAKREEIINEKKYKKLSDSFFSLKKSNSPAGFEKTKGLERKI